VGDGAGGRSKDEDKWTRLFLKESLTTFFSFKLAKPFNKVP